MIDSKTWRKKYKKLRTQLRKRIRKSHRFIRSRQFANYYAIFAVAVLFITTIYWSWHGGSVHNQNADQLVGPALFNDSRTLHGALFPAAHSEILKWPLFWLIAIFNSTDNAFLFANVILCLVTVGGLAYVLHKIVNRRHYYGTLVLALASCLALIPAQPYPGALLPLNFAMIATRNVEYIVFLVGLWLMIRSRSLKSLNFWLAASLFGILFASDRLFLSMAGLGSLLMVGTYWYKKRPLFYRLGLRWLESTMAGAVLGALLVKAINSSGYAHINGTSSPYDFVRNLHDLVLGIFYGILDIFTNLGANPAYDATIVKHVPASAADHLLGFGGLGFVLNLAIICMALFAAYTLVRGTLVKKMTTSGRAQSLSLVLIANALAAFILFISTNHYYPVDARYLTIWLFALFTAGAWRIRQIRFSADRLVLAGGLLSLGIALSFVFTSRIQHQANQALADTLQRDQDVTAILKHHHVDALVGDYWRIIPLTHQNQLDLTPMPLINCSEQRDLLTSKGWQLDLKHHSFAYLLTIDHGLTDFPSCNFDQIIKIYGRPNSTNLVAGSASEPKELLLIYERGINLQQSETAKDIAKSALLPTTLDKLPATKCDTHSVINTVAHQDDDLLFLSPTLIHHLKDGDCVRTVYLTAGDAGHNSFYWLSREQGTEAAYAEILHADNNWLQRTIQLGPQQFATFARLAGHSGISLIFLHLHDGNLMGQGFPATNTESLAKLNRGQITQIHSIDRQSSYTHDQLVNALAEIFKTFDADEIDTQSTVRGTVFPDHSDHNNVGLLTTQARDKFSPSTPIFYFEGYPSHEKSPNVSGDDLTQKEKAFGYYAQRDDGVCWNELGCHRTMIYAQYIDREYTSPN